MLYNFKKASLASNKVFIYLSSPKRLRFHPCQFVGFYLCLFLWLQKNNWTNLQKTWKVGKNPWHFFFTEYCMDKINRRYICNYSDFRVSIKFVGIFSSWCSWDLSVTVWDMWVWAQCSCCWRPAERGSVPQALQRFMWVIMAPVQSPASLYGAVLVV